MTVDRIRENYRRQQARSPRAPGEPTPERQAKAAGIGYKKIGQREVRRLLTTIDILERNGHLSRHLRSALDAVAIMAADAMSVAVDDNQPSTARLISGAYDGMPPSGYAPGEISERRAEAQRRWVALEREIPPEMWEVFQQLVSEETGQLEGRPRSLARFGHEHGWQQDRQAVAAGGMLAISALAVVHHVLKRGILEVKKGASALNLQCTQIEGSRKKR